MPRPREFDMDDVLERAMQLFWSKGYKATSLDNLTDATKLSRGSLYNSFGSKHGLFLSVIERYMKMSTARMVANLENGVSAKQAIADVVRSLVDAVVTGDDKRGCLLSNSAMEMAPKDTDTSMRVAAGFAGVEDALYFAIVRGQDVGEISSERDARSLARFLVSSINGLRVVGRARPERGFLNDVVKTTLSVLD